MLLCQDLTDNIMPQKYWKNNNNINENYDKNNTLRQQDTDDANYE